jgi:hypothetical protein
MNSIRKLVPAGIASTVVVVVVAFVVAPATALAHWTPQPEPKQAGTASFVLALPAPSAACVAARQAIVTARAADRVEDLSENAANEATEDPTERADLKALWTNLASACWGAAVTKPAPVSPPSSGCVAAKTALKNALIAEKAHEAAEASSSTEHTAADWQEDQADFAAIKPLWKAAAAACGFSFTHW